MQLPQNIEFWNPSMRGAYMKGRKALQDGLDVEACPYQDKRKSDGRLTWSRAYRAAWVDGWRDQQKEDAITEFYSDRNNSGLAALSK